MEHSGEWRWRTGDFGGRRVGVAHLTRVGRTGVIAQLGRAGSGSWIGLRHNRNSAVQTDLDGRTYLAAGGAQAGARVSACRTNGETSTTYVGTGAHVVLLPVLRGPVARTTCEDSRPNSVPQLLPVCTRQRRHQTEIFVEGVSGGHSGWSSPIGAPRSRDRRW
jgi:hypothetical protein